jgi:succinylglutamate desuccinylase
MSYDIVEMQGKSPGPTSIIMAGVHGNERCGVNAFKKLLPTLKLESGRILFVYGNPRAIDKRTRCTETDLNRMFKNSRDITSTEKRSYEYKRAQLLKKYLNKGTALLDIHASNTPKSERFIICEKNAFNLVKYMDFKKVVSGFDSIEPGGTDYYMNKIGNVGICIECGYNKSKESTQIAINGILSFLRARKHISGKKPTFKQRYYNMYLLYKQKSVRFKLSKQFGDFDKVKLAECIGVDGEKSVKSPKPGIILFARNTKRVGEEVFLLGTVK